MEESWRRDVVKLVYDTWGNTYRDKDIDFIWMKANQWRWNKWGEASVSLTRVHTVTCAEIPGPSSMDATIYQIGMLEHLRFWMRSYFLLWYGEGYLIFGRLFRYCPSTAINAIKSGPWRCRLDQRCIRKCQDFESATRQHQKIPPWKINIACAAGRNCEEWNDLEVMKIVLPRVLVLYAP